MRQIAKATAGGPLAMRSYEAAMAKADLTGSYAREIGTSGLRQYGGYVLEEWLLQLQGRRAAWAYREMADNDPVVGAILFAIEMLARGVEYRVEGGDAERAEFIEQNMHDMSHSWLDFIAEALSMLPYGWSFHEIVYKRRMGERDWVIPNLTEQEILTGPKQNGAAETEEDNFEMPNSEFDDGKIGWRKLPVRAQESLLRWEFTGYSGLKGMVQIDWHGGNHLIPIQKALLFRTTTKRKNPEGRSILRNAYTSYYNLINIKQMEAIGIERDLVGIPKAIAPEGIDIYSDKEKATLARVEEIVTSLRKDEDQGIILPFGWTLELMSTGGQRMIETDPVIRRYEQRIATSMLADFVLLGQDQMGSFAMTDIKSEIFGTAVDTVVKMILETINKHGIPRLLKLNNMKTEDPPRIVASTAGRIDVEQVGRFFQSLALAGAPIPWTREMMEEVFKRGLGLPVHYDDIEGGLVTQGHSGGEAGASPAGGGEDKKATGERADARERTISSRPSAERRATLSKAEIQKGAMVALYPPPTVAAALAPRSGDAANGLAAKDLHITLAYLGDADKIESPDLLAETIATWAKSQAPLNGQVSGHGHFEIPEEVTYASPDVPGISSARDRLCGYLRGNGFEPSEEHGFTPHITLAHSHYDPGTVLNPLHFGQVSLVLGGKRQDFPLEGLAKAEETEALQGVSRVLADRATLLSNQLEHEVHGALRDLGTEAATAYMHEISKAKPSPRQINSAVRKVMDRIDVNGWVDTRLGPIMVNHAGRVALDAQRILQRELGLPDLHLPETEMNALIKEAGTGLGTRDIEPQVRGAIVAAITSGVQNGENPLQVASRIKASVPQGRFTRVGAAGRAQLISRDQTANMQRKATLGIYKSSDHVKGVIVRDGIYGPPRSDAVCMDRDGEEVPIDKADGILPNHPLCTLGFDPIIG